MADYTYFSPATIELQKELTSGYHDTLLMCLATTDDIADRMSAIATHCDVLIDDDFDQKKWDDLCDTLRKILYEHKREKKNPLIIYPYQ